MLCILSRLQLPTIIRCYITIDFFFTIISSVVLFQFSLKTYTTKACGIIFDTTSILFNNCNKILKIIKIYLMVPKCLKNNIKYFFRQLFHSAGVIGLKYSENS